MIVYLMVESEQCDVPMNAEYDPIANAILEYSDQPAVDVNATFRADDRESELIVDDNGSGFPNNFNPETMSNHGLEMAPTRRFAEAP